MADSLLTETTFTNLGILYTFARPVAEYRTRMGAPWVTEVVLFEDVDGERPQWTVIRKILGSSPQLAYQGSDLDKAVETYGVVVNFVRAQRAALWSL